MASFMAMLQAKAATSQSLVMVGIDPPPAPANISQYDHLYSFSTTLVTNTHQFVCGYKPNMAFFERAGPEGTRALQDVVKFIKTTAGDSMPVLIDAKRGDIGSTAKAYVDAVRHVGGDGVTLSPLMGYDSVEPFITPYTADSDSVLGGFILCKTSNPGSEDFLNVSLGEGEKLYERIARMGQVWCDRALNSSSSSSSNPNPNPNPTPVLGLVVGATDAAAIRGARKASPRAWILAPGVGAQNGDLSSGVEAGIFDDSTGGGIVFPISRGIANAADQAAEAKSYRDKINSVVASTLEARKGKGGSTDTEPDSKKSKTTLSTLSQYQTNFITLSLSFGVLKFGSFTLKSGRTSPYFFNAGLFSTGSALSQLATAYANAIMEKGVRSNTFTFDVIFGPAYKGISLGAVVAAKLYELFGLDVGFTYNRKEAKDHGEGGTLVGADIKGKKILVLDDVITAGTAIREAHSMITQQGGTITGIVIALDRMEKRSETDEISATGAVRRDLNLPVVSVVDLDMMVEFLEQEQEKYGEYLGTVKEYRSKYGC